MVQTSLGSMKEAAQKTSWSSAEPLGSLAGEARPRHTLVLLDVLQRAPRRTGCPASGDLLSLSLSCVTRVAPHCVNTLMILHVAHSNS